MKALLPGLIIVAGVVGSYLVRPAETAIEVTTPNRSAEVKIVKPGGSRVIARGNTKNGSRVRLGVDPGRYVVGGDRLRSVRVAVAEDEVVSVVLEVRR